MDRERIREIVRIAQESPVAELCVREGDLEVRVVKRMAPTAATAAPASAAADGAEEMAQDNGLVLVRATKVGLFHRGKGPGIRPLVEEGDRVADGQAVATLESLRKLTEVTADTAGIVVRFLVEDGSAVEFGQPLLELRPTEGAGEGGST